MLACYYDKAKKVKKKETKVKKIKSKNFSRYIKKIQ